VGGGGGGFISYRTDDAKILLNLRVNKYLLVLQIRINMYLRVYCAKIFANFQQSLKSVRTFEILHAGRHLLHVQRRTAYCRRDQSSGLKGRGRQSVRTEPLTSFHKKKGRNRNFVIKIEETENLYMAFLEVTPTVGSIIGT